MGRHRTGTRLGIALIVELVERLLELAALLVSLPVCLLALGAVRLRLPISMSISALELQVGQCAVRAVALILAA